MSSELVVTLIRLGYLALLWIFVFATLGVLRRDIFGTVVTQRGPGRGRPHHSAPAPAQQNAAHAPDQPPAAGRGGITRRSLGVASPQLQARQLVITAGSLTGTTMPLGTAPILIGRSPACTLVVDDSYTSGQHARLYNEAGQWFVEDLNSTNGTFVDGERLGGARPVGPGNQIRIGQTVLEIGR